ncbi:flagellar biosynthetic protein FliO [Arthrobacter sp. Sa2BUA2]|uniref:Flagellar biosynthetic protein FliO n=1 Tax=Arthrobacter pullicola TaxID=2762224 RepID=A0ABR8YKD9_9MICC|nr:flagellar biosynthetic protein FliO [Arthrobacter pullicola]MBD8044715.1 flagellar biosynthetic protein FliO [Arthrobacter pullicola]
MDDSAVLALRVLVSLGVVLGLLWWLQRRLIRGRASSGTEAPIRVLSRQVISPKASVVVLETGGQRFLLGVTESNVNVLHTSEAVEEEAPDTAFAASLEDASNAAQESGQSSGSGLPRRRDTRRTAPAQGASMLNGSILSPDTWRQSAAFLRRGRQE